MLFWFENILATSEQSECPQHNKQKIFKFNFSTHKLKSVTGELINFCFNGGDQEFIGITNIVLW